MERIFANNFPRNYEKKLILGTSEPWIIIHPATVRIILKIVGFVIFCILTRKYEFGQSVPGRDVTTGVTSATAVAPYFSDTLTLSQPRQADYAHHPRGRS